MKRSIFLLFIGCAFFITACNGDKTKKVQGTDLQASTGNEMAVFTVDEIVVKGKVSTQYFGSNKETDNFSILCQQDEPLYLLQATFANEKEAKSNASLQPKGASYKVNTGEYGLTLTIPGGDQFIANDQSKGALKVKDNKLIITDFTLYNRDGKERKVNGTIPF